MEATSSHAGSEADDVRSVEKKRLSALLTGNVEVALQLHADDFQLVTPLGAVFSKEEDLGAIAAGILHYHAWELDSPIDVRMYPDVALIRYRAQVEVELQGRNTHASLVHRCVRKSVTASGGSCGHRAPGSLEAGNGHAEVASIV